MCCLFDLERWFDLIVPSISFRRLFPRRLFDCAKFNNTFLRFIVSVQDEGGAGGGGGCPDGEEGQRPGRGGAT